MRGEGLNPAMLRKLAGLFDSPRKAESETALLKAVEHCQANGIRLGEGLAKAFAGDGDTTELQQRIEDLERENDELSEGLLEMEKKMGSRQGAERHSHRGGFIGFTKDLWAMPQARLAFLYATVALRMWTYQEFEADGGMPSWFTHDLNYFTCLAALVLFVEWIALQYERSGKGPVILQSLVTLTAIYASVALAFSSTDVNDWLLAPPTHAKYQIPSAPVIVTLRDSLILMAATFLASISNAAEKFVRLCIGSRWAVFPVLRSWFS